MDENPTAQGDFLGNFAMVMIVLWVAGAALFVFVDLRGVDATPPAAATEQAAPATAAP